MIDTDTTPMKRCARCHTEKKLSQFRNAGKDSRAKDGLYPYCKPCAREYQRENPYERDPSYHAKWYQEHKQSQLEKSKETNRRIREKSNFSLWKQMRLL
jgi:hypothetical protein